MSVRKMRVMLLRIAFVPIVLAAAFVGHSWELDSTPAYVFQWLGYAFLIVGLGVRMWCMLYIGQRKSRMLVTTGPYSICRNPSYLGTFAVTAGAGLCFGNLPMTAAIILLMVPMHVVVTLAEEKHLLEKFGDSFEQYMREVPRFWIAPRLYRSPDPIDVSINAVRRAMLEAVLVLLVHPLGAVVQLLQQQGIIPVLWQWA